VNKRRINEINNNNNESNQQNFTNYQKKMKLNDIEVASTNNQLLKDRLNRPPTTGQPSIIETSPTKTQNNNIQIFQLSPSLANPIEQNNTHLDDDGELKQQSSAAAAAAPPPPPPSLSSSQLTASSASIQQTMLNEQTKNNDAILNCSDIFDSDTFLNTPQALNQQQPTFSTSAKSQTIQSKEMATNYNNNNNNNT
jgi:hypothetical protein